ncbi:hypothetical protein [Methanobacterium sp.]
MAPLQINIEKWKNRIKNNFVIMAEYENKIVGSVNYLPKVILALI